MAETITHLIEYMDSQAVACWHPPYRMYPTDACTSQRCHECGHTEPGNRESQAVFRCRRCGNTANADLNAARNIAGGRPVSGRGRVGAIGPPGEASTDLVAVTQ